MTTLLKWKFVSLLTATIALIPETTKAGKPIIYMTLTIKCQWNIQIPWQTLLSYSIYYLQHKYTKTHINFQHLKCGAKHIGNSIISPADEPVGITFKSANHGPGAGSEQTKQSQGQCMGHEPKWWLPWWWYVIRHRIAKNDTDSIWSIRSHLQYNGTACPILTLQEFLTTVVWILKINSLWP